MSSTIDYTVYHREVLHFLHTTSIKFTLFAEAYKPKYYSLVQSVSEIDDSENPYYLNLAGQYAITDITGEYIHSRMQKLLNKCNTTISQVPRIYVKDITERNNLSNLKKRNTLVIVMDASSEKTDERPKCMSQNEIWDIVDKDNLGNITAGYYWGEDYVSQWNEETQKCEKVSVVKWNKIFDTKSIKITIVETGEETILRREVLDEYYKTRETYKIGTVEYSNLLAKYPDKVGLIKSIIYPVKKNEEDYTDDLPRSIQDVQVAINAGELDLLSYDNTILEEDENDSLIEALKNFLAYVRDRWFVKDFSYESAYAITFMGMIYSLLPSVLFTQRIRNLRTARVHSLHVWEYLSSKGLEEYKFILTRKQSLFLYRNIDYLIHNKGKKTNIEILAENLLSTLHVKLVGKTILQETKSNDLQIGTVDAAIAALRESILTQEPPTVEPYLSYYNTYKNYTGEELNYNLDLLKSELMRTNVQCIHNPEFLSDYITSIDRKSHKETNDESHKSSMDEILFRMNAEGYYPRYSARDSAEMNTKFGLTEFNNLPTRLLELEKAILNTKYLTYLTEFMMDSLMYHWSRGKIKYNIQFQDPLTKTELNLSVGDTVALLYYAHMKSLGESPINLPKRYTTHICYHATKPRNLPTKFYFDQYEYWYKSFINVDKILSEIPFDPGPFTYQTGNGKSGDRSFSTTMSKQFHVYVKHMNDCRRLEKDLKNNNKDAIVTFGAYAHTPYQRAMTTYYKELTVQETVDLNLSQYLDYKSWKKSSDTFIEFFTQYDRAEELGDLTVFDDLCRTIWDALLPIDNELFDDFTGANRDNTQVYRGLKKLFIQLCSYRLYFLDTNRISVTYLIPMFESTYPYHIYETDKNIFGSDLIGSSFTTKFMETNYALMKFFLKINHSKYFKEQSSHALSYLPEENLDNFTEKAYIIQKPLFTHHRLVSNDDYDVIKVDPGISFATLLPTV